MADQVHTTAERKTETLEATTAFMSADLGCTFGPSFFLGPFGHLVRDRCPDSKEHLPLVRVRLADGETLDVCHIIGASPHWAMLAVGDSSRHHDGMTLSWCRTS